MTDENLILSLPWRHGLWGGSIVAGEPDTGWDAYGGILVCESCPRKIAEKIIEVHNRDLAIRRNEEV